MTKKHLNGSFRGESCSSTTITPQYFNWQKEQERDQEEIDKHRSCIAMSQEMPKLRPVTIRDKEGNEGEIFLEDANQNRFVVLEELANEAQKHDMGYDDICAFTEVEDILFPDDTNPKDLIGAKKTAISLVPPEGIREIAKAMKNGADKYGSYNWRDKKVQYMIYLDAIMRHTLALIDREDIAEDSKVHHLGHIGANATILLDAIKYDCLVDNRPTTKKD